MYWLVNGLAEATLYRNSRKSDCIIIIIIIIITTTTIHTTNSLCHYFTGLHNWSYKDKTVSAVSGNHPLAILQVTLNTWYAGGTQQRSLRSELFTHAKAREVMHQFHSVLLHVSRFRYIIRSILQQPELKTPGLLQCNINAICFEKMKFAQRMKFQKIAKIYVRCK